MIKSFTVGYDFDGVLWHNSRKNDFRLIEPCVIITGRSYTRYYETIYQLDLLKLQNLGPIYFFPYINENIEGSIVWKTMIINQLELKTFYEDDKRIYDVLKTACLKTEIKKSK